MLSRRGFFAAAAGAAAIAAGGVTPASAVPVPDLVLTTHLDPEVVRAIFDRSFRTELAAAFQIPEKMLFGEYDVATELPIPRQSAPVALITDQKPSKARLKACDAEPRKRETQKQFMRRMSLPCPGRLE